ncbi:MAG: hypothetical protein WCO03_00085, partial [bacterium]
MIPSLKKYFWLARFSYLDSVAYFGDFVARMFTIFLRIWIFTQLYQFTYRSYGLQEAGGLTLPMLIWSLMIVQSLGSTSWLSSARVIETEVKSGQIAYSLGRPYSYLGYHYAQFGGRAVLT